MDYKQLNDLLKDLRKIRNTYTLLEKDVIHEIEGEGNQGDEGVSFEVYKLPFEDLHIRLKITTDSYGDNEGISGLEFVKPIQETIQTYKPV